MKDQDLAEELATSADDISIHDPEEVLFVSDDEEIAADARKMVEEPITPIKEEKKIKSVEVESVCTPEREDFLMIY